MIIKSNFESMYDNKYVQYMVKFSFYTRLDL